MRAVPPADLRQSMRIPVIISIGLLVESEHFRVEHRASTIDFSDLGARLRTRAALLPGETIGIIISGDSRHAISARVVWAQRVEGDLSSLAGVAFLETLPA